MDRAPPELTAVRYAQRLADACAAQLGDHFVAAFLHGSLGLGGFVHGRSDVDILLVAEEAAPIRRAVASLPMEPPARVDLRVATRRTACSPPREPIVDLHLVLRPGRAFHIEAESAVELDLLVELALCRAHGRRLLGPAPERVVGPVPGDWLLSVATEQLERWYEQTAAERREHAELIALTACRMWLLAEEGRFASKAAAGDWALTRDPALSAVRGALDRRCGRATATVDDTGLQAVLTMALDSIRARE